MQVVGDAELHDVQTTHFSELPSIRKGEVIHGRERKWERKRLGMGGVFA